jgi:hypothetical protein
MNLPQKNAQNAKPFLPWIPPCGTDKHGFWEMARIWGQEYYVRTKGKYRRKPQSGKDFDTNFAN